jgi:hypothetical protein
LGGTTQKIQVPFVLGRRLVLWKWQDVLQATRLSIPPQNDSVRLEYLGRMPRVVLNALKERYGVREQHALEDVGQNVLVLEVQGWETNIPQHACGEPFANCSYMLVPDMPALQTRSNFPELVVIAGGSATSQNSTISRN